MQDIGLGSRIAHAPPSPTAQADHGTMPEWNLGDL